MPKYIFFDTWAVGLAAEEEYRHRFREFVQTNGYTVLLSSLSLVELYNPGWSGAQGRERAERAAKFYASVPCVVVDPKDVWDAEIANQLDVLDALPIRLHVGELDQGVRAEAFLRFLRRDKLFLDQGLDVEKWSNTYHASKQTWLSDVSRILDAACQAGNLQRNSKGEFVHLPSDKERFLFSLDLRQADPANVTRILSHQVAQRSSGTHSRLGAVRLSSLLFWYLYVDIDNSNRPKHGGSDLGDIYHLSLLPYCSAFTADRAMYGMLQRIKEPIAAIACSVMTKPMLERALRVQN